MLSYRGGAGSNDPSSVSIDINTINSNATFPPRRRSYGWFMILLIIIISISIFIFIPILITSSGKLNSNNSILGKVKVKSSENSKEPEPSVTFTSTTTATENLSNGDMNINPNPDIASDPNSNRQNIIESNSQNESLLPSIAMNPSESGPGPLPVSVSSIPLPERINLVEADIQKQESVKQAFKFAYDNYQQRCFGQDEIRPVSGQCSDWLHLGATLIDSLSTMWVMGLKEDFNKGRDWVENHFNPEHSTVFISVFETIIRILGGLLSAYDLSKDPLFLRKATLLADRLIPAFNTNSGLSRAQINLASGDTMDFSWTGGASLLAEVGTVQLELAYLSKHTGNNKYFDLGQRIIDRLDSLHKDRTGLYPIYLNHHSGMFQPSKITWGAMGDSFYEYLLKMWLITGKKNSQYQRMYLESVEGMMTHLVSSSNQNTWIADWENGKSEKMDHLVCFVPGLLTLGVYHNVTHDTESSRRHLALADKLMSTCVKFYTSFPLGLTPEYARFVGEEIIPGDPSFKLRPETVESLFVMYRLTQNPKYREWGWTIFNSIQSNSKTNFGFSGLNDCRQRKLFDDRMESFFLAETLKYLYLLFSSDDLIPLTGEPGEYYVFNTECHPLTSWKTEK